MLLRVTTNGAIHPLKRYNMAKMFLKNLSRDPDNANLSFQRYYGIHITY